MPSAAEQWTEEVRHDPELAAAELALEVHERLVERMGKLGLTRADLARRMGVSPAYVTKILRGANISLLTLAKVAVALECTPRELLGVGRRRSAGPTSGVDERLARLLIERHRAALEALAK